MILIDTNLLVYAHVDSFPQHHRARNWLDDQLNGSAPVGLPWQTLLGFLRIVSSPRVLSRPEPIPEAWARVRAWLGSGVAWIPQPTERHPDVLGALLDIPGSQGNLIPDAHLAALAIEHGLMLCSNDHDFSRFPKLRWMNPLRA